MKCSFRQLLSMVIALVLVLSCVPFQVFAEECEHAFAEGVCTVCGAAEVPAEEPAAEPVEEPAEEAIEEPVEEPVAEPVEEITEEPVAPAEEAVAVEAEAEVEMAGDGLDGGEIDANESFTLKVKINPSSVTTEDQPEDIDIIVSVWNAENERVNDLNTSYIITNAAGQEVTLDDALQTPGTYTVTPSYYDDGWSAVTVETASLIVKDPSHICVNNVTGVKYESLSEALNKAEAGQTVRLLCDYTETKEIIIRSGVTLDLGKNTLTAKNNILGFDGSYLDGDPFAVNGACGKLVAEKSFAMLTDGAYVDELGYSILPVYHDGGYVFTRMQVYTGGTNQGLQIDEESNKIYFQFVTNMTGDVRRNILNDGASGNKVKVIVRLEWQLIGSDDVAYQDFVYGDTLIANVCGGGREFAFTMTGYNALSIDIDTVRVKGMVVADSGAVEHGDIWPE